MNIKEWEGLADKMSLEDLWEYSKALETLHTWPAFLRAYEWTGTKLLQRILEIRAEIKQHKKSLQQQKSHDKPMVDLAD